MRKLLIVLIGSAVMLTTIVAQTNSLPACCKSKSSNELCCNKKIEKNVSSCKSKDCRKNCCSKNDYSSTIIKENNTASIMPGCCANKKMKKRSFFDKLLGRNKKPACCSAKK